MASLFSTLFKWDDGYRWTTLTNMFGVRWNRQRCSRCVCVCVFFSNIRSDWRPFSWWMLMLMCIHLFQFARVKTRKARLLEMAVEREKEKKDSVRHEIYWTILKYGVYVNCILVYWQWLTHIKLCKNRPRFLPHLRSMYQKWMQHIAGSWHMTLLY